MNRLILALIFACCVTLATELAPQMQVLQAKGGDSDTPLAMLLGDTRRLFANQLFTMADVYFHSGYYPTIFDRRKTEGPSHLDVATHEEENTGKESPPDDDDNFMGPPRDAFERFGRHFIPTVHTHLKSASAQEILPWLRLSADLDPKRIDTYVTASYWLRTSLHKYDEAEQFLREGLRANPDSYEILLELGRVYYYGKNDPFRARNIWELALKKWLEQEQAGKDPDPHVQDEILGELVRDDERSGNLKQLLADLQALEKVSPNKTMIDQYIQQVQKKLAH